MEGSVREYGEDLRHWAIPFAPELGIDSNSMVNLQGEKREQSRPLRLTLTEQAWSISTHHRAKNKTTGVAKIP